ncbi:metallophosphoesterase [Lysinibacillus sp. LZ02]|uniref:metallophosphoesterase n=1 Tax=Lysinibacillus sp. LZ02 TaxID=3420668 RepID=UPI003D3686CB
MKKLVKIVCYVVVFLLFLYANNQLLVVTEHVVESEKLPKAFDGYRITQISDLHDATFGDNQQRLVEKVRATNPDAIFLTGDLIDSRRYDLQNSLDAVAQFVTFADVYYVLGNHEVAVNQVEEIYEALERLGVQILPNQSLEIQRDGERLTIIGIEDPLMGKEPQQMLDEAMATINPNSYKILLSHRPEKFETYVENVIDIAFTGHAHGGQVRLPFIGGLIAPGQGWFPTYTNGIYEAEETKMVVSRGLGNSLVPQRLFNLPEIVVVELKSR